MYKRDKGSVFFLKIIVFFLIFLKISSQRFTWHSEEKIEYFFLFCFTFSNFAAAKPFKEDEKDCMDDGCHPDLQPGDDRNYIL